MRINSRSLRTSSRNRRSISLTDNHRIDRQIAATAIKALHLGAHETWLRQELVSLPQ